MKKILVVIVLVSTLNVFLYARQSTTGIIVRYSRSLGSMAALLPEEIKEQWLSSGFEGSLRSLIHWISGYLPEEEGLLITPQIFEKLKVRLPDSLELGKLNRTSIYRFPGFSEEQINGIVNILKMSPFVESAEPDYVISGELVSNDPDFSAQWGLSQINAEAAWDFTTGSEEVIVAVIDTGINYNHPELRENVLPGYDYVNSDDDPFDDSGSGHGTHVAGIIGAVGNNGTGGCGVAWNVKLLPVKVLDANDSGYTSDSVRALDYAIANGARVINMSLGFEFYSNSFYDALNRAREAGVLVIVAAGNGGDDEIGDNNDRTPIYPASYNLDNIIAVACLNSSYRLSSFSNYGPSSVDLAAPGRNIYSTAHGAGYLYMSGTSMAAPFVAGAAALILSVDMDLNYRETAALIIDNSAPLQSLEGKVKSSGTLDLFASLSAMVGTPLKGDVNGDSVISIIDALMIAQYYVNMNPPGFNLRAADLNDDGIVTIIDALIVAQLVVGLIEL